MDVKKLGISLMLIGISLSITGFISFQNQQFEDNYNRGLEIGQEAGIKEGFDIGFNFGFEVGINNASSTLIQNITNILYNIYIQIENTSYPYFYTERFYDYTFNGFMTSYVMPIHEYVFWNNFYTNLPQSNFPDTFWRIELNLIFNHTNITDFKLNKDNQSINIFESYHHKLQVILLEYFPQAYYLNWMNFINRTFVNNQLQQEISNNTAFGSISYHEKLIYTTDVNFYNATVIRLMFFDFQLKNKN